jgi:hypothetical protein
LPRRHIDAIEEVDQPDIEHDGTERTLVVVLCRFVPDFVEIGLVGESRGDFDSEGVAARESRGKGRNRCALGAKVRISAPKAR